MSRSELHSTIFSNRVHEGESRAECSSYINNCGWFQREALEQRKAERRFLALPFCYVYSFSGLTYCNEGIASGLYSSSSMGTGEIFQKSSQ